MRLSRPSWIATTLLASSAFPSAHSSFAAESVFPKIQMTTTQGVMEFELYDDLAPNHVKSFLKLASQSFFDGQAFHRIIPGFVIQGGGTVC